MASLTHRLRRLRAHPTLRALVREHTLSRDDLIMPFFVREGQGIKKPIGSMPGQFQWSVDLLVQEAKQAKNVGIGALILFGIPDKKDDVGSQAYALNGVIQQAVAAIKDAVPEVLVITDVCLCEYTSHGHCGIVREKGKAFTIDNDSTLDLLGKIVISHVRAGADVVAPSGMMDSGVGAIRQALDGSGFGQTPILAYSAKYASSFYGPFREAAESPPQFGDRSTYQMDIANAAEAMREIELDLAEGADIIMVKPALAFLDVVRRARERFLCPLAAYNVSGEYAMIKAAAERGWLDERKIVLEVLTSIKRAGADIIVTYFAKEVAEWLT